MTADAWDPVVYERFKVLRAQPFHDLLALVEGPVRRMVDLGCGTGELTRVAVERLGATDAVGVDNSAAMLAQADTHTRAGRLRFEHGDLGTWTSTGDHDLVLSNAALHWAPDHRAVLARWVAALAPGGQLAVQMPCNHDQPSHTVAAEVAHEPQFLDVFGPTGPPPDPVAHHVLEPVEYAQLLFDLGCADQHVRLQVYPHVLPSTRAVVDWVSGTSLTRFKALLAPDLYDEFVRRYEARLVEVLGDRQPYFFPFKRLLIWARRTG